MNLLGWIIYGLAVVAYVLCVYGFAKARIAEHKRNERMSRRRADNAAITNYEWAARLLWHIDAVRQRHYQAALNITAERARNTHPKRVAEMFSRRVPDTSLLKEVV